MFLGWCGFIEVLLNCWLMFIWLFVGLLFFDWDLIMVCWFFLVFLVDDEVFDMFLFRYILCMMMMYSILNYFLLWILFSFWVKLIILLLDYFFIGCLRLILGVFKIWMRLYLFNSFLKVLMLLILIIFLVLSWLCSLVCCFLLGGNVKVVLNLECYWVRIYGWNYMVLERDIN